jgi:hypothetical protein
MELLDFPVEILLKILSKLDQKTVHSSVALVSKKFLQLTRSPQLLKCVEYNKSNSKSKVQSLLDMLRENNHIEKLILDCHFWNVLEVLKVVAPHGSLRHLKINNAIRLPVEDQEDWKEVFSSICEKLTTFSHIIRDSMIPDDIDVLAPLANASMLESLELDGKPNAFRQMADNYTCLQNLKIYDDVDCEENSDMAYFLEKQSQTLTCLSIRTNTENPLPAISKCQNLTRLTLKSVAVVNLDSLGSLSNLKSLCLGQLRNCDLGKMMEAAKFQHLTEIKLFDILNLSNNDVSQIAKTYGQQV